MVKTSTGASKIGGLLPNITIFAHKIGTFGVKLPNGRNYINAVFPNDMTMKIEYQRAYNRRNFASYEKNQILI